MKSKSLLKKQIGVFIFLFIFMFTNFLSDIVPFINYSVVFGEVEDKIYEKDFKNSEISNWNFYKGKGDLKIEDSKLKVTRDVKEGNNMVMADENSPEILNSEAEVKFSIKDGEGRFGIVLRASDPESWLFVGYNIGDSWLIETPKAWKDNIKGPKLEENKEYKLKARVVDETVTIWLDGKKLFEEEVSLNAFPKEAGKVGFRTWYDEKAVSIISYRYGKAGSLEDKEEPKEKVIKAIDSVEVTTFVNTAPSMPNYVNVTYEDGTKDTEKVTWDEIDPSLYTKVNEFEVVGTVEETELKAKVLVKVITGESIQSDSLKVMIDNEFPSIISYEYLKNNSVIFGQDEKQTTILINGKEYTPNVNYEKVSNNKAEYRLNIDEIGVVIRSFLEVNDNIVHFKITKVDENGGTEVNTIEIPNHNVLSVRSNQEGAALAGAKMYTAVKGTGDEFINLNTNKEVDSSNKGYMYAILNTSSLSGSIWTNSVHLNPKGIAGGDNARVMKKSTTNDEYVRTSLWSGEWTYRAEGAKEIEPLPEFKVVITDDLNEDGIINWQDGAIAYRKIMNNPKGAERIPELVVQRIPFNFASHATNPFLKTLDETKRVYLATDGLGQNVLLKGYGSEGHDSAHPDYGLVGKKQGGAEDLNTLIEEGKKYNAYFGVHINATESYPEAKMFSENLVNKDRKGWDWLDPSYYINTKWDAVSGNRLKRLEELKKVAPGLEFIYLDVWYNNGWEGRQIAKEINSQGWRLETEFPGVLEYDATWNHWAVDYAYGGLDIKGYNSDIVRFIRNHQKDTWIARHPLLGGAEMADYEGWQGRTSFDDMIKMTFNVDLPTKYIQHFPIMKWGDDTITLENDVVITNKSGERIITKDSKEILKGNKYLLPWNPKEENKLYHYNLDGGNTTWQLPNSYAGVSSVKLYKLTDLGREFVKDVNVNNNSISIDAEAAVPYVVVKGEKSNIIRDVNFGQKSHVKDPGFNTGSLKDWKVSGGNAKVVRNDRGQYELKIAKGKGAKVEQELTGLTPGHYSASVNVAVDGKRKASINVENSKGNKHNNFTESSIAENYIAADVKHGTFMQRMRVKFTVPEGVDKYTLSLEASPGTSTVTFDDVRVAKVDGIPFKEGAVFFEDFENIDMGVYPFVKGPAGGSNDPRTHISEIHEPYTQKGWNGKKINDVISGNHSLKMHKESRGKLLQTVPQNFRFEGGKYYRISFDYEAEFDNDFNFIMGDREKTTYKEPIKSTEETERFTKELRASNSNGTWFGFESISGKGDLVIDNLVIEEIESADTEKTEIVPIDLGAIPNDNITVTASSEDPREPAINAIDDKPGTIWHTKWNKSDELPQYITLDLGKEYEIDKLTVLSRQSGNNGLISKYELSISTDGEEFTKIKEGAFDVEDRSLKELTFNKVNAKYVRLTALEGVNGWASLAEMKVFRNPVEIKEAEDITLSTLVGEPPVLPGKVKTFMSDGEYMELPVSWDGISSSKYNEKGSFTVKGDINNSGIFVNAQVNVVEVRGVEAVEVKGPVGEVPELPETVVVTYSDGTKDNRNVSWGEYGYIDPEIFKTPGRKTIEGKVAGINEKAIAKMLLTESNKPKINITGVEDKDKHNSKNNNKKKAKLGLLPKTGSNESSILSVIGAVVLFIGLTLLIRRKR